MICCKKHIDCAQRTTTSLGDEAVAVPHPPWIDDVVRHRPSACRYPLSLLIARWWSMPCLPPPLLSGPSNLHHPCLPAGRFLSSVLPSRQMPHLLHSLNHAESSALLHTLTRWAMQIREGDCFSICASYRWMWVRGDSELHCLVCYYKPQSLVSPLLQQTVFPYRSYSSS